jgi:hypothetical protein
MSVANENPLILRILSSKLSSNETYNSLQETSLQGLVSLNMLADALDEALKQK